MQMQEAREGGGLEDDMVEGDLGAGMEGRMEPSFTRKKNRCTAESTGSLLFGAKLLWNSSIAGEAHWTPGINSLFQHSTEKQYSATWNLVQTGSLDELSKEDLKSKLQEATEVIDMLRCELEVAHRYLEGKYEALKILQGKAILDKATSHTKSLLHKCEERNKALEKEVNSLQWELSFSQVQMKRCEQSWEQKYNRILSENEILADNLEEKAREIRQLRAENCALGRHRLELMSLLNVKEKSLFQETKPQYDPERDGSVLELAVLGACRCLGVPEACPCSRTAAASRKQLIELQQELEVQCRMRDEAMMVADAFRIAFEQQLRKRSEHFILLAEANILKSHHCGPEGANRPSLISVSQRLRGLLPCSLDVKMPDDVLETLYTLLDLLNDKEEALAHQKKVSIMLARSAEQLQRQLQPESQNHTSESLLPRTLSKPQLSESRIPSKLEPPDPTITFKHGPSESSMPAEVGPTESRIPSKQEVSQCKISLKPQLCESRIPSEPESSEPTVTFNQGSSESSIPAEAGLPEFRISRQEASQCPIPLKSQLTECQGQCWQLSDQTCSKPQHACELPVANTQSGYPSEPKIRLTWTRNNHFSEIQPQRLKDISESTIQQQDIADYTSPVQQEESH
ncbi:coiled-coil domain-containing protein 125 [Thalassophryne amazonica]|uniref:coiled-coil domain-containing protein 125 n=1 Tax=Thalassophryne amazonica TaxID=390379 RepID=UPI0014719A12|nr:coiled-coil domain-containing protein 125 [Thalassophryne amazonica]